MPVTLPDGPRASPSAMVVVPQPQPMSRTHSPGFTAANFIKAAWIAERLRSIDSW